MRIEYREEPCRSALNRVRGMHFNWSLNPYMGCAHRCTFCYVRAFERRAERPSDDRYGTSIRVKINIAAVLREELARPGWKREMVAVGAATDPYQPPESRYKLTRSCIQAFAAARNPFSIITRGPMIIRDIDVLQEASRRAEVSVHFSIPTLEREVWKKTEPGTAPPRQRLRALEALASAGIRTGVGLAPILPGLSDRPEQLAEVVRAARDAGAEHVWAHLLYLRPGTREHFLEHLARDFPEQLPLYEKLYAKREYLRGEPADTLQRRMRAIKAEYRLGDRRGFIAPEREAEQLALGI